jgi:hypothetical protein
MTSSVNALIQATGDFASFLERFPPRGSVRHAHEEGWGGRAHSARYGNGVPRCGGAIENGNKDAKLSAVCMRAWNAKGKKLNSLSLFYSTSL